MTRDKDAPGDVSQFQALTTALASTIGTGNIVGVGTRHLHGRARRGVLVLDHRSIWDCHQYGESLIAVKYRVRTPDGRMQGGAMYALERGLNLKWLGMLFAFFAAVTSLGTGCGTQINAIAEVIETTSPLSTFPSGHRHRGRRSHGGGHSGRIQSIAKVCEKLVPFMAFFYVAGCLCHPVV